ncbi:hypothetical protein [Streptomyces xiamenensis]|uniref:hypothetical protein n=1 Tax=Streptomyces xiamenensis TaxID=408015 RepID=UPI0035D70E6B
MMRKTTGTRDPYGYDPDSDTVRVRYQDLGRLLFMFRQLVGQQPAGTWKHMRDYDVSFERLADAVDAADEAIHGAHWEGPNLRLRCTTAEPVYAWPDGAPYDGGTPATWNIKGHGSHATPEDDDERLFRALCGFQWARREGQRIDGLPDCPECRREVKLCAARRRTRS